MASDNDETTLKGQAFPVEKVPKNFAPDKPPSSVDEYLQQVVWEAQQCQEIMSADIDRNKFKSKPPKLKQFKKTVAPDGYTLCLEIQREILADFSNLREKLVKLKESKDIPKPPVPLPGITNSEEWCRLCFGNSFQLSLLKDSNNSENTQHPQLLQGQKPLLSILLNIGQKLLWNLIEWHCNWLEVLGFSNAQGQWLYALLSCLEKPLTPETSSSIRHIAKMCAQIRAELDSVNHPDLPQLNVIICIIARYFNQEDLADG